MKKELTGLLSSFNKKGFVTVLSGAGMSAESGIPTFRGEEGYWKVGSRNYHPQEMATYRMFSRKPYEVWKWYLYRKKICNGAEPNAGHVAIAKMEDYLKDRFLLITQNVDGLHKRAGNNSIYEIHGNIDYMRDEHSGEILKIPQELINRGDKDDLSEKEKELLKNPLTGSLCRPHILWFDECYNEEYYKFESSLSAVEKMDLLIVIGTTGATTLPYRIISTVTMIEKPVIVIDPYPNEVTGQAERYHRGYYLPYKSGDILPKISSIIINGGENE